MLGYLDSWVPKTSYGGATPAPDDLRKLLALKNSCCIAKVSATRLNIGLAQRKADYELKTFREHAGEAVRLAREITDEIYRNSALYYLIDLFVEARNEAFAQSLFDVMHAGPVRDRLLRAHPQLAAAN
jgi:hypothetical protein